MVSKKPIPFSLGEIAEHHKLPADQCWRCGEPFSKSTGKRNLERCHCIPDALGGDVTLSNLVILCRHCHAQAPDVSDPAVMLRWIDEGGAPWRVVSVLAELKAPWLGLNDALKALEKSNPRVTLDEALSVAREVLANHANTHGFTDISPATSAWVIVQTLKRLAGAA